VVEPDGEHAYVFRSRAKAEAMVRESRPGLYVAVDAIRTPVGADMPWRYPGSTRPGYLERPVHR
jgi:hypothetical protein